MLAMVSAGAAARTATRAGRRDGGERARRARGRAAARENAAVPRAADLQPRAASALPVRHAARGHAASVELVPERPRDAVDGDRDGHLHHRAARRRVRAAVCGRVHLRAARVSRLSLSDRPDRRRRDRHRDRVAAHARCGPLALRAARARRDPALSRAGLYARVPAVLRADHAVRRTAHARAVGHAYDAVTAWSADAFGAVVATRAHTPWAAGDRIAQLAWRWMRCRCRCRTGAGVSKAASTCVSRDRTRRAGKTHDTITLHQPRMQTTNAQATACASGQFDIRP
ncbi:conserved hypothetical protein [Burkholderia vietnamiensis]|nr:conserved hypothetical protein [Burkholderia vietnamiensis]